MEGVTSMQGCGAMNDIRSDELNKIDIYIDTKYEGNFAKGKGSYSIVLEILDNENNPQTKEHFGGYNETTNNRLCILAIIHALKHVNKSCEIEIHINSGYVAGAINTGRIKEWMAAGWTSNSKKVKNAELWEKYIKLAEDHLIYITDEKENTYTRAMIFMIGIKKINYITDYRKENEYV